MSASPRKSAKSHDQERGDNTEQEEPEHVMPVVNRAAAFCIRCEKMKDQAKS